MCESDSPCGEGSGVGVVRCGTSVPHCTTPHPNPPPQGGRECALHPRASTLRTWEVVRRQTLCRRFPEQETYFGGFCSFHGSFTFGIVSNSTLASLPSF